MHAGVALAGYGGVRRPAKPEALRIERAKREEQQHDRQDRSLRLIILCADDGEKNFGRQHIEISAEHERIAEIRHAFDEAEQKRVGKAGPHQWQATPSQKSASDLRATSAPPPPSTG